MYQWDYFQFKQQNVHLHGLDMKDTYTIQLLKYIWFYNVYILTVKSFIHTKIYVAYHFEKVSMFTFTKFTYTIVCVCLCYCFYFENTVTRNVEICGLNSYTDDLINTHIKQTEFLHIVKELTKVEFFIRKVWVCSHVVIGALRGVGTYDF